MFLRYPPFVYRMNMRITLKGQGILSRTLGVPIYANEKTWMAAGNKWGEIKDLHQRRFTTQETFHIGDIAIKPFPIPHDAAEPVGFNVFSGNKKLTVATDIGHVTRTLYDHILGSDHVLLEANHDVEMVRVGSYPWHLKQRVLGNEGHLSNEMAGKLMVKLVQQGVVRFSLGHLSKENNFPELVYQTVKNILSEKPDANWKRSQSKCSFSGNRGRTPDPLKKA
jgi:phosphoribosyl 1,2-cyclic phosphodiesterase